MEKKEAPTDEELDLILSKSCDEIIQDAVELWKEDEKLRFSQADLDLSLFSEEDLTDCFTRCSELNLEVSEDSYQAFLDACKTQLKSDNFALDREVQLGYNYFFIRSLVLKLGMILPKVQDWIDGSVDAVLDIQKKIELQDGDDIIIGYIDFTARMKDGTVRIWDLKTSSKAYKENEANESQQLTIYSEYATILDVGFLVVQKSIRKREPRVRLQEVIGKITQEQADKVFAEITEIVNKIVESGRETSLYPKNLNSCHNFGGCDYRDYCKWGSEKGLERKGES